MGNLKWNGPAVEAMIRERTAKAITDSCVAVRDRARKLVSIPDPPAAPPGEPPHERTGRGRASITYEVDDGRLVGRVGTMLPYFARMEFTHPWLRRALIESRRKIESYFSRIGRIR